MDRGGVEMRLLDLLRRIDRRRFGMEFCAISGKRGVLDREIHALGSTVHHCPLGPMFPWRFQRLLRAGCFHAVHSHVHLSSGFFLRLAAAAGVPIRIAHFRSTGSGRPVSLRRRLQDALMRHWIDRRATHILGVGEAALAHGWRADWQRDPRCAVIHNGLDTAPFAAPADRTGVRREFGWPEDCPLLIHVGRMCPPKNHPRLVEIAGRIMHGASQMRLLLVGAEDADLKAALARRLGVLGVGGRTVFAGNRGDVPRLMLAADLMLFPSVLEGLPGAVLEACAAGLPVLASDLPGIVEIAGQFPGVRFLPLQSADEQWAAVAGEILARQADRSARTAACRAFAASLYGLDRCAAAHELAWCGTAAAEIRRLYV